jgi:nucleoside 2-deoxyribosyltransferase
VRYYIASRLENAPQVRAVRDALAHRGWRFTYDWTLHGAVRSQGTGVMRRVAYDELMGVKRADVVLGLLPGGRGTHVEIGAAIAFGAQVVLYSPDIKLFELGEETCAFYHHERVTQLSGEMSPDAIAGYLTSNAWLYG